MNAAAVAPRHTAHALRLWLWWVALLAAFNAMVLPAIPAGLLLGAITGGALVALLRQPAPGTATLDTPAEAPRRTAWRRLLLAALVIVALTLVVFTLPYAGIPLAYWDLSQRMLADDVSSVAFSPDGTLLVASSPFGGMQVWDAASGTPHNRQLRVTGSVADVAWSPDGRQLATAGCMSSGTRSGGPAELWDAATGKRVRTLPGRGVSKLAFSPDGALLAGTIEAQGSTARLWEVATGKPVRTLLATEWVGDLAFSPDGALLASTSADGPITLWDVATGAVVRTLPRDSWSTSVAFRPDGALLATAARNGRVQLWEAATGTLVRSLWGHRGDVWGVAFSPDGALLATAGDDWTVRLWDVDTGAAVRTLKGHRWIVRGVAFSPDGTTLASASFDGTLKLWDVATGTEIQSIDWVARPEESGHQIGTRPVEIGR